MDSEEDRDQDVSSWMRVLIDSFPMFSDWNEDGDSPLYHIPLCLYYHPGPWIHLQPWHKDVLDVGSSSPWHMDGSWDQSWTTMMDQESLQDLLLN